MQISGLEEEFQLARALPRLLYIKTPAPDRKPHLAELLARMKQEASASYRYFRTPAELGRLIRDDLATLLSERFAATRPAAEAAAPPLPEPPRSRRRGPSPLPVGTTSLVGREQAIDEVAGLLDRPAARLVTLTGPGGIGKTRLALAVAERLRDGFDAGVRFVPLAEVTQPKQVLGGIGRALGVDPAGMDSRCRRWRSSLATSVGCSSSTTWSRCARSPATWRSCWRAVPAWRSWPRAGRCWGCGPSEVLGGAVAAAGRGSHHAA